MSSLSAPTGGSPDSAPLALAALELLPAGRSQLSDMALRVAAEAAARAGAPVLQLRVELDPDNHDGVDDLLSALVEQLGREGVGTVVVERRWPTTLLRRMRSAGLNVWWLRQGVDVDPGDDIDCALGLDLKAIETFAAGGFAFHSGIPGLAFRESEGGWRATPGRPAAAVRRSLREGFGTRHEVSSLPGWPSPSPPHLAVFGRPGGCPYRADVRRNERFAGLELDPQRVRVHGCSFCLDGRDEDPGESRAETIAFLRAQVVAALGAGARRLLLVDDRPMGVLGELVAGLPSCDDGERVLLLKMRADELARDAVRLAAFGEKAVARGWALELHCVGIESFCDDLLTLFNKGYDGATARQAARLLRDLVASPSPGLRAARSRAHGFLLWTPWTTLDHLTETARGARETGLDSVRAGWVETRLRLDRRTPLHVLAAADGLLSAELGSAPSRADRQGYDRDLPWRFRDRRAALVDVLLRDGALADWSAADRLEALALFARDVHPEVADGLLSRSGAVSELAREVELYLSTGGWEPHHEPAAVAVGLNRLVGSFDLDVELVRRGDRQGAIREELPAVVAAACERIYRIWELPVVLAGDARRGERTDVLVSRDEVPSAQLVEAHAHLRRGGDADEAARVIGGLLGYPTCCTAAFLAQPDRSDDVASAARSLLATVGAADPLLNPFGLRPFLAFHPCRYDCLEARRFAENAARRLRERLGREAERAARDAASLPLLVEVHRRRWAFLGARWDGEWLVFDDVVGPGGDVLAGLRAAGRIRPGAPPGLPGGRRLPLRRALLLAWDRPVEPRWWWPGVGGETADSSGASADRRRSVPTRPGVPAGGSPDARESAAVFQRIIAAAESAGATGHVLDPQRPVVLVTVGEWAVRLELATDTAGSRAYARHRGLALSYRFHGPGGTPVSGGEAPPKPKNVLEACRAAFVGLTHDER